jgi:hypothetical protein
MDYTKGPWVGIALSQGAEAEIISHKNASITPIKEDDGRLMTAAPDMYEALKAIAKVKVELVTLPAYLAVMIEQALAKAEGK